jgi:hypothetical protein
MTGTLTRLFAIAVTALLIGGAPAGAQQFSEPGGSSLGDAGLPILPVPDAPIDVPGFSSFAPPQIDQPLSTIGTGEVVLSAQLTDEGAAISRGLVWRIFRPDAGPDGKLPLVASAQGGTSTFTLEPGSYLVHASFGRAGATKRIKVGGASTTENLVLDAGGLKLDATLSGGQRIPPDRLRFSVYEAATDAEGERALILPDVSPNTVVRLNTGIYHVVSTYGNVNAVIRSDLRVEAGMLTEASVEHRAAEITLKLVREAGGEAIADTSWVILTGSGDIVRETVGAFASMVLAEGEYAVVAKNRDRIYQREFSIVPGRNQDVEVIAADGEASAAPNSRTAVRAE